MRLTPLRIEEAWIKVVYAVAANLFPWPLALALRPIDPAAFEALATVIQIALVVVAAGVFRSPGEPVVPPRPWWRLTFDRRLAVVLGILLTLLAVWWVWAVGILPTDPSDLGTGLFSLWLGAWFLYGAYRSPARARREKPFRPLKPFRPR